VAQLAVLIEPFNDGSCYASQLHLGVDEGGLEVAPFLILSLARRRGTD
jgi:hypothetical protein